MKHPIEVATMERSNFHTFVHNSQIHCLTERAIATMFNKCHRTVSRRLRRNWSVMQAVDIKPKPRNKITTRQVKQRQMINRILNRGLRR